MSYVDNRPRIYIYDIGTGRQRVVTESANQTFAPRFSPDGRWVLIRWRSPETPTSTRFRRTAGSRSG
jgi:Tol biopolymer transport system component